jgi:diguanylate cyclase (GGDEF)-like protein
VLPRGRRDTVPSDTPTESEMAARAYRALGDTFAIAVALMDAELVIQWVNPAAPAVLGWPDGGIVGRNAAEFIHPDDVGNFLPLVSDMADFAGQTQGPLVPSAPVELPCRLLRADGGWTAMSVTGRVLDEEGNLLAVVRPSAESHAFAEVLDGLGAAAPLDQMLSGLARLLRAQFAVPRAWVVHDSNGKAEVLGSDDDAVPFDPAGVLARLRALDNDEWFVLVDGDRWLIPVTPVEADRVLGVLVLPATRPEGPSPWDELVAHRTANLTAVAFARDLRDRMLELAATTDHLTGLLNRREFDRALRRQAEHGMPVTLFFLDLDDFKAVNDEFGHLTGDAVLLNVGRRLQRVVRSSDEAGRLGGDEFIVSCPGLRDEEVEPTRQRIESVVGEPIAIDGRKVSIGVSVGVARAFSEDQLDTLITRSDADMFERKRLTKERKAGYGPTQVPDSWPR